MSGSTGVVVYETVAQAHGRVRVRIMRLVHFHFKYGFAKQSFLFCHIHVVLTDLVRYFSTKFHHTLQAFQCHVIIFLFLGQRQIDTVCIGQDRLFEHGIHIGTDVVIVFFFYRLIEVRQIFGFYLLGVIVYQGRHRFLVDLLVPVLVLLTQTVFPSCLARFSSCVLQVVEVESDTHQIGTSKERLVQERDGAVAVFAGCVRFFKFGSQVTEAFLSFFAFLCPFVDLLFLFFLLFYDFQLFKRLVHADTVFPIVGTVGIFGSILQTDFRIAVHPFLPYPLLHATYIDSGFVGILHAFHDSVRREITVGTSGIADGHTVVSFLETF